MSKNLKPLYMSKLQRFFCLSKNNHSHFLQSYITLRTPSSKAGRGSRELGEIPSCKDTNKAVLPILPLKPTQFALWDFPEVSGTTWFTCMSLVKETAVIYVSYKQTQLVGNILQEASLNAVIVQGLGVTVFPTLPISCCHREEQSGDVEVHSCQRLIPGQNTNASSKSNHQIIRCSQNVSMARGAGSHPFAMRKQLLIFSVFEEGQSRLLALTYQEY